jgi:hypothetical protein
MLHFFADMAGVLKNVGHRLLKALSFSQPASFEKGPTVRFAAMWIIIIVCRFAGVFQHVCLIIIINPLKKSFETS